MLAKCAVASRHAENALVLDIEARVRRVADDVVLSKVFDPTPPSSAIHALLILSLWPSTNALEHENTRDSRLILASAVRMAQNRHFDQPDIASEDDQNSFEQRLVGALLNFVGS